MFYFTVSYFVTIVMLSWNVILQVIFYFAPVRNGQHPRTLPGWLFLSVASILKLRFQCVRRAINTFVNLKSEENVLVIKKYETPKLLVVGRDWEKKGRKSSPDLICFACLVSSLHLWWFILEAYLLRGHDPYLLSPMFSRQIILPQFCKF